MAFLINLIDKWNRIEREYRPLIFLGIGGVLLFVWVVFIEIKFHYFLEFNGRIIGKEKNPPKELPELKVKGNTETFPVWKWEGIEFDSVQIGDSIVKRKFEAKAFYYRNNHDGTYQKSALKYWTDL